jgi:glycosyltransferase involved in cell wall biosynthesis
VAPRVSLIIRCHNEEAHIGRLLTGVSRQTQPADEIIVVDSGSTDATLAIASAFPVSIVPISSETFSFGRALNVGIEASTGDVVVFASAHVYPLYDTWLELLTAPFGDEQVALAYGRQQAPRDGRFSEQQLLKRWFPGRSVPRQRDPFCNNANAAIRRSIWEEQRYDEHITGLEDLEWAKRAVAAGLVLAYVAEAVVVHTHDEDFRQVVNRYRREAIAHKQIYDEQGMTIGSAIRLGTANILGDIRSARVQGALASNLRDIIEFRSAQFYGTYRGFRQQGPVPELLRQRFYYPPSAEHKVAPDDVGCGPGRVIDYDDPLPPR